MRKILVVRLHLLRALREALFELSDADRRATSRLGYERCRERQPAPFDLGSERFNSLVTALALPSSSDSTRPLTRWPPFSMAFSRSRFRRSAYSALRCLVSS